MTDSLKNIKVIGLGQACLDVLGRIHGFPSEDQKVELNEIRIQCGGPASTALVTLSRLGIRTAFLGVVSDDDFGHKIVKGLEQERVDPRYLKIRPGFSSQFAFIAITQGSGNRTIFWHKGSVPPLTPEDVDLTPFSNAKILHLDGLMIPASKEAALQAKRLGLRVVLDAGTMREGSRDLAGLVDVLIASERFVEPIVGNGAAPEEGLDALRRLSAGEVVMTMGSRGSIGWDGKNTVRQKAFPIQTIDTTGAGDVYHGAYVFCMLKGLSMRRCMRFASAVSALKCEKIGAREGIPNLDQVEALLRQFPDL